MGVEEGKMPELWLLCQGLVLSPGTSWSESEEKSRAGEVAATTKDLEKDNVGALTVLCIWRRAQNRPWGPDLKSEGALSSPSLASLPPKAQTPSGFCLFSPHLGAWEKDRSASTPILRRPFLPGTMG